VRPEASASGNATWRWMLGVKTTLAIDCASSGGRADLIRSDESPAAAAHVATIRVFFWADVLN
jgi:hypothetical protein